MCLAARTIIQATGISGGREPSRIIPSEDTGCRHLVVMELNKPWLNRIEQAHLAFPLLPPGTAPYPLKKRNPTKQPKKPNKREDQEEIILDLGQED